MGSVVGRRPAAQNARERGQDVTAREINREVRRRPAVPPGRPPKTATVTDEAIDKTRQLIISGEWGPGDRLPPAAELAAQLGLSRNPPREAVRALSMVRV